MYLLIILGIAVALSCGTVNYVYATKRKGGASFKGAFLITHRAALLSAAVVLLAYNAFLTGFPELAFRLSSFKTALIATIIVAADGILVSFFLALAHFKRSRSCPKDYVIAIVTSIFSLIFFLNAAVTVKNHVFVFDDAGDFKIIENLPKSDTPYHLVLLRDIDFSGEELDSDGFGSEEVAFILDGKGYTISGIDFSVEITSPSFTFLRCKGGSSVKNLTVRDCRFSLTANYYDVKQHEGYPCEFYISNCPYENLENVTVSDTEILIKPAIEDVRADEMSYVSGFESDIVYLEGDVSVTVRVTRED